MYQPLPYTGLELKPLDALRNAYQNSLFEKHKTVPPAELMALVKTKQWKLNTSNGLTQAIIFYTTVCGAFSNRIASAGRKIKTKSDKEIYIPGTTKRGTPDIDIVYNGISIKIECKQRATKDRQSQAQKVIQQQIQSAGGIYYIAEAWDEFFIWWNTEILTQRKSA